MGKRSTLFALVISLLVVVLVATGVYVGMRFVKVRRAVAFQCGLLSVELPRAFVSLPSLPRINDKADLDQFGCLRNTSNCLCAKIDPVSGEALVLGIAEASSQNLRVPADAEGQTAYLRELAEIMSASRQASTTMTDEYGSLKTEPSLIITSVSTTSGSAFRGKNIFFIHNGRVYDIAFKTSEKVFASYWPMLEQSLATITFSR